MIAASATDVSLLEPFQTEWRVLGTHRHNVLLEGPVEATDTVLRLLQPRIREPIAWSQPQVPLNLPSAETHTLILRDVAGLSTDDQRELLVWLNGTGVRTQVVSTAERTLFERVTRGLFDEALYYRLNVMLLRVGSGNPRELPQGDDAEGVDSPITDPTTQLA
jgi:sigma-54-interacting transcriptional regulator